MTESADQRLNAIVYGRVQGVGFRFFVLRQALALGLTGGVRNLEGGGTVEVGGGKGVGGTVGAAAHAHRARATQAMVRLRTRFGLLDRP